MYISKCRQNFELEDFNDDYKLLHELKIDSGCIDDLPTLDVIRDVKVCIYSGIKPFTYQEAEKMIIDKYFGVMSIESQDYGYSEYTIEGFNVYDLKIGNHDLIEILNSNDRYKILTIEKL
ncbi:MAG: hypothetical protein NC191_03805 [Muribaculaceae bacterium]|nr:hypothetical protein [Muribaculaceae bacterium]